MIRRFSLHPVSANRNHADGASTRAGRCAAPYCLLVVLLFLSSAIAGAQFDTAEVLGTVKDPNGATISGATVVLTNSAKGIKAARQTDASGSYEFTNVQVGDYTLTIRANGFQTSITDRFTVNVGARQRVDVGLKLGAATESVTVSGAASELETDTSDRGETVQGAEAVVLPLNGRAYADLSKLVPGVRQSLIGVVSNPPREASYTPLSTAVPAAPSST